MEYSRLKALMTKRGYTLTRLCTEIGITRSGLLKGWENETISFKHVRKVTEILEIDNHDEIFDHVYKNTFMPQGTNKIEIDEMELKYREELIKNDELRGQVLNLTDIIKSTLIKLSEKSED